MKVQIRRFSSPDTLDRKGQQPVPVVDSHDVSRIIERDVSPESREMVRVVLAEFGSDQGPEVARVHLAALKLSGSDVDQLIKHIDAALRDWRDVVAAAEYPEYMRVRSPQQLSIEQRQRIIEADWNQYQNWFGK